MPTRVEQVLRIDDVGRALAAGLGSSYTVTPKSDTVLKVHRSGVVGVTVRLSWADGATSFRVRPSGAVLVLLFNAVVTAPKVRRLLAHGFPATP